VLRMWKLLSSNTAQDTGYLNCRFCNFPLSFQNNTRSAGHGRFLPKPSTPLFVIILILDATDWMRAISSVIKQTNIRMPRLLTFLQFIVRTLFTEHNASKKLGNYNTLNNASTNQPTHLNHTGNEVQTRDISSLHGVKFRSSSGRRRRLNLTPEDGTDAVPQCR
jgi:hypothetical protein